MRNLILLLTLLSMPCAGFSQTNGCTDPKASNYNSLATVNDGSCTYNTTIYTLSSITNMSDTVIETSGLVVFDGQFWTFNDSGNSNQLFSVNLSNGKILRTVTIKNAVNIDWEALTQSDAHLFMGDFGNNVNGARSDLRVYKIDKNQIRNNTNDTVIAEIINFSYADQASLTPVAANTTNFDAEAMIFAHDSLHIFSKNWSDRMTRHYTLSANAGTYQAHPVETLNVEMLITDASYSPVTGNIVLLGYNLSGAYPCYCWLLYDYQNNRFFNGNKRRIDLGTFLVNGQTEGIFLQSDNTGYVTNEAISVLGLNIKAKLQAFDFSTYLNRTTTADSATNEDSISILYPNPFGDNATLRISPDLNNANYTIKNGIGKIVQKGKLFSGDNQLNTSSFTNGIYLITIEKAKFQTIKSLKIDK